MYVQIRLKKEINSEEDDSEDESDSYNTPLEDNTEEQTDEIPATNEEHVNSNNEQPIKLYINGVSKIPKLSRLT